MCIYQKMTTCGFENISSPFLSTYRKIGEKRIACLEISPRSAIAYTTNLVGGDMDDVRTAKADKESLMLLADYAIALSID